VRPRTARRAGILLAALLLVCAAPAAGGQAGLRWRLVQPQAPAGASCGEAAEACAGLPLDLGQVGDIEFFAPNRGVLVTAGNGSSVPAGVWGYNGVAWHELSTQCGATHGRIAWASAGEFWTVSDERPGQPADERGVLPPLEDDSLCRFTANPASGALEIVRSYAAPAFSASSYQPISAAACLSPSDCWFGGAPLPAPQPGAFALHWSGSALEAAPNPHAWSIPSIAAMEGQLLESASLPTEEVVGIDEEPIEILHPFLLYGVGSTAATELERLRPFAPGHVAVPEYVAGSYPAALAGLRLSSVAEPGGQESLWAAAGPATVAPKGSQPAALTVLHDAAGVWSQVLGPAVSASLASDPAELEEDLVSSIAAEPDGASAWIALQTQLEAQQPRATALATVAHVQADGTLAAEQLPTAGERAEGVPPQGSAAAMACPARNDCWLATSRGALYHLSEEGAQTLPADTSVEFNGPLVTYRPPDEGLPSQQTTTPGNAEESEALGAISAAPRLRLPSSETYRVQALPYTHARTRVLRGHVLEVSFVLTVKSRVRLLARRHAAVVSSTSVSTLPGGRCALRLELNPRRWPTKLEVRVRPLAPLPTEPASRSVNTITTGGS
jgi:hypothetical protein